MDATVRDNPARSRFELDVDGETAFANYRIADGVLAITHTETPAHLRGRGIAGRVVAGALDAARARGLKVTPRCDFARDYVARHPEYHDLVA
jgi:hypothetical protein